MTAKKIQMVAYLMHRENTVKHDSFSTCYDDEEEEDGDDRQDDTMMMLTMITMPGRSITVPFYWLPRYLISQNIVHI